jgi:DNA-binding CsgD family transcriptional regulator
MVLVEGGAEFRAQSAGRVFAAAVARPTPASMVDGHLRAGRLMEAQRAADALLARPLGAGDRDRVAAWRALARSLTGGTEDAFAALSSAAAIAADGSAGRATVLACWAEAALWNGMPRQAIEQATAALVAGRDPQDVTRAVLARAWAELELDRGPGVHPPRIELANPSGHAALAELRGIHALAREAWAAAAIAFREAAHRWQAGNAPRALVCRWAEGEALRRGADRHAAARLRITLDAACAMGFEPLAARIRRSLRLAGARPASPRGARPRGRLTARERDVLELVERGRTNDEIARRMGLGRPTVARILSNAMVKLGAESRAHAVVIHGCAESREPESNPWTHASGGTLGEPRIHDEARAILAHIAAGRTLGAIARELGLSRRTADRRLADARAALGAARTTEAVARAQRLGWLG